MMVVVVVMMMVVMVMMVLHRRGGRGRSFLRDGVAGEADGQRGGGEKALEHGEFPFGKGPDGLRLPGCAAPSEPRMNRRTRHA